MTTTNVKFEANDEQRRFVQIMAAGGFTHSQMAQVIHHPETHEPLNVKTLRKHFRPELDDGGTEANAAVVGGLYANAIKGRNVAAQIFICKARMGWRQTDHVEHTGEGGGAIQHEHSDTKAMREIAIKQLDRMSESFDAVAANDDGRPAEQRGNGAGG